MRGRSNCYQDARYVECLELKISFSYLGTLIGENIQFLMGRHLDFVFSNESVCFEKLMNLTSRHKLLCSFSIYIGGIFLH